MHYLFLTTGTWDGNASFVRLREFGREMLKRNKGIRVSFVADDLLYNRQTMQWPDGADVHYIPLSSLPKMAMARRKLLKQLRPDFVHVLNPYIKAYLALRFTGIPLVGDWDEWPARRPHPLPRKLLEVWLDHWMRTKSKAVVVASKYLQQQFISLGRRDTVYIPYATYLHGNTDGDSPFTDKTVVYMGNLFPAYDHDLLFDAAVLLKQRGVSFRMRFLGSGPDIEKWRAFVVEHALQEQIDIPGFVSGDELWRNLRHAHALLFPIRENMLNLCRCPSKTYAYAQAKRPIITNRVGEVAQVLGENAIYIEPTPQAFADALESILQRDTPDVDFNIERHNWAARTETLLKAIGHG